jgi:plasmid stabilization system protein ParE
MSIEFLGAAEVELTEVVQWYDAQRSGLGDEFLNELRRATRRIEAFPNAWPKLSRRSRRCRLNRFPYGVVYQVRNEMILILAIMHLHRKPRYWRLREEQ